MIKAQQAFLGLLTFKVMVFVWWQSHHSAFDFRKLFIVRAVWKTLFSWKGISPLKVMVILMKNFDLIHFASCNLWSQCIRICTTSVLSTNPGCNLKIRPQRIKKDWHKANTDAHHRQQKPFHPLPTCHKTNCTFSEKTITWGEPNWTQFQDNYTCLCALCPLFPWLGNFLLILGTWQKGQCVHPKFLQIRRYRRFHLVWLTTLLSELNWIC